MKKKRNVVTIVIADDDAEDREMIRKVFEKRHLGNPLVEVEDGEDLMDYLLRRHTYAHLQSEPLPGLILLDLNMPRIDGRDALKEIKSNPKLGGIPVVILTTSNSEEDVLCSYKAGANGYIVKPITFEGFVDALGVVQRYWIEIVEAPVE